MEPNKGLSTELYLKVLEDTEMQMAGAASSHDLNQWVVFHSYVVVCYVPEYCNILKCTQTGMIIGYHVTNM
jgi:hypothetical protein